MDSVKDQVFAYLDECEHPMEMEAVLSHHPWCKDEEELFIYMEGMEVDVPKYMDCVGVLEDLCEVYSPEEDMSSRSAPITRLYRMLSIFANLSKDEVICALRSCAKSFCVPIIIDLGDDARMFWPYFHVCNLDDEELCECPFMEIDEILTKMEDALMDLHNGKVGAVCNVWEEQDGAEECMTSWIPKELVEDVAGLCGEFSMDTRIVRK